MLKCAGVTAMTWSEFFKETFTVSGRLGRKRYYRCVMKVWAPCVIPYAMNILLVDVFELSERLPTLTAVMTWLSQISTLVFLICMFFLMSRRLNDFDCSSFWAWLLIAMTFSGVQFVWIPMIIFWFWVGKNKGTDGKNKYGEPPPDD